MSRDEIIKYILSLGFIYSEENDCYGNDSMMIEVYTDKVYFESDYSYFSLPMLVISPEFIDRVIAVTRKQEGRE